MPGSGWQVSMLEDAHAAQLSQSVGDRACALCVSFEVPLLLGSWQLHSFIPVRKFSKAHTLLGHEALVRL